jgi:hypothetical protein
MRRLVHCVAQPAGHAATHQLLAVHVPPFDVAAPNLATSYVPMKHQSASLGLMTALDITDADGFLDAPVLDFKTTTAVFATNR